MDYITRGILVLLIFVLLFILWAGFDWFIGKLSGKPKIKVQNKNLIRTGVAYSKLNSFEKGIVRTGIYGAITLCLMLLLFGLFFLLNFKQIGMFLFFLIGIVFIIVLTIVFFYKRNWKGLFHYFNYASTFYD